MKAEIEIQVSWKSYFLETTIVNSGLTSAYMSYMHMHAYHV